MIMSHKHAAYQRQLHHDAVPAVVCCKQSKMVSPGSLGALLKRLTLPLKPCTLPAMEVCMAAPLVTTTL
jgi:hypothetical protein